MKILIVLTAACCVLALAGLTTGRADAHEVATRCTSYGCSQIVCNRTGDRCRRYDEVRGERYEGRHDDWRYHRRYSSDDERRWRRNCDPDNPTCRQDWSADGRWWDQYQ